MAVADNMPNDTPADLPRRIKDLERAVRELSSARTLDRATITAAAGLGVRTADFDGTDFAHPGTAGNYFGGDGAVLNSLYLRPGSVTNDALTNPVIPGAVNRNGSGFALAPAFAELIGVDVVVPAGCTSALITMSAWLTGYNSNTTGGSDGTGADYIYIYAKIGATSGQYNATGISGNGGTSTASGGLALSLTGLTPGSTVRLGGWGSSQYTTLAASAYNSGTLTASLTWLR